MFRLAVVHSLPSAIRLEEEKAGPFRSFAERCVEHAPQTSPRAIPSAIAATRIRIGVILSSPPDVVIVSTSPQGCDLFGALLQKPLRVRIDRVPCNITASLLSASTLLHLS